MPDVGTLTVNLSANTASFEGPLSKAGQTAKNTAQGIQEDFDKIDMHEARGGVALLGEEIGIHLPRHVQTLIAGLPMLGAAFEAAFPILAVIAIGKAVVDFTEKLSKAHEQAAKLEENQTKLGTVINNTFNSLDEKFLQAGIHADDLNGNHMAALRKELELINKQSMSELAHTFDILAKQADATFASLESHWYSLGIGSEGAKHALTEFQTKYDSLLALGKDKDASDLLAGTRQSAEHTLAMIKQMRDSAAQYGNGVLSAPTKYADIAKFYEAENELKKVGLKGTDDELKSQQALLDTLDAQEIVQKKLADLKAAQGRAAKDGEKQKEIGELDKDYAAFKASLDKKTAESITYYELEKTQGRITETELSALKDAALEGQLKAEMKHLEDLKQLNAGRPKELQRIQAQEDALEADHNAKLLKDTNTVLTERNKLREAFDNRLWADTNKQQTAQADAEVKLADSAITKQNKLWLEQAALIQGLGDRRVVAIDKEIKSLNDLIATGKLNESVTTSAYARIHQLELQRQKDLNNDMIASGKLGQVMHGTLNNMIQDGLQWQQKVGNTFKQTVDGMNTNLAQFITTGQANWKQLAASAIESIINIGLQYVESKLMMMIVDKLWGDTGDDDNQKKALSNAGLAQSDAALAAANTLATAPWPANIPASAAVLALGEGYAAMSAVGGFAEQGAVLPNREMLVHTHPEEMILPKHISNFIVNAAGSASGGAATASPARRGGDIHVHLHDVTDGAGVQGMVQKQILPLIRREVRRGRL